MATDSSRADVLRLRLQALYTALYSLPTSVPLANGPGLMQNHINLHSQIADVEAQLAEEAAAPPADPDLQRRFMEMAVEEARKSKPEDDQVHPMVGVVVVKNGEVLATAHRGELGKGDHAEFTALQKKLRDVPIAGATVYTTLEPCTNRSPSKTPCVDRLIERQVKRVVIGMPDPHRTVYGEGWAKLREAGIKTVDFPGDLMAQVKEMNREFIRHCKNPSREQGANEGETPPAEVPAGSEAPQVTTVNDLLRVCQNDLRDQNGQPVISLTNLADFDAFDRFVANIQRRWGKNLCGTEGLNRAIGEVACFHGLPLYKVNQLSLPKFLALFLAAANSQGGAASPKLAKHLVRAIDALLSFIRECDQVREDPRGAFGRFILRSEMDRFRELDTQVFLLAHEAGLLEALPRQDELKQQMYHPDVPMCRPNDPDSPLVQFEGKTNLPGDWTPDYFMPVWDGRWKEDMAVLRALAESRMVDQSEANGGTG
jgi:pyrimidine deaminase RibD-like protein